MSDVEVSQDQPLDVSADSTAELNEAKAGGGEKLVPQRSSLQLLFRVGLVLVLALSLATAAVAVAAPRMLEPLVESIDAFLPAENGDIPEKSLNGGSC